ncbi:galactose oxidase [Eremomyces bilateralis CBS 781.70]|uniref:Galactose oxidase n=1 Tax=Eremomyces bilateralis CBS 781.70 TaxID=1392243 RepID=A0A6G1G8A1_9PEZI|nr:galactose oxidase [Eremomyces bilateralis CBS 781.70]KAF1814156.1 galactose oxidase [Eremomyces bilateralis CBS 781.70]
MLRDAATLLALALCILTYRTTLVAAISTTSVAPISNERAGWVITTDSAMPGNEATLVLDNNEGTFWHSAWFPDAPLPHWLNIDMGTQYLISGFSYTPRQDEETNGNIGMHSIEYSVDGNNWATAAQGTWANDNTAKLVNFQETLCRYVRLTATSEAGNRGPWSSAADIAISYDASYIAPAPQTRGQWGLTVNFPLVPVAVGLVYDTGEVLAWSSWNPSGFGGSPGGQTVTATYNPSTSLVSKALITDTHHDMFCPGISLDFNGRMIITGGNDAPRTSIYNPPGHGWISGPDMQIARGYQSSATLSNGWVFTIGGSWSGGIFQKNGEYYDPSANTWNMLNDADVTPMLTNDAGGLYRSDNHAWLFGWKNQAVFHAGPSTAMNWYTTTGSGGVTGAGNRLDSGDAMCGMAVMYDAVAGKILTMGGSRDYENAPAVSNTYVVTIDNVGTQAQTERVADMNSKRIFANAVGLPNGQVFVVGGQDYGSVFNDDSSIMYPELYTPSSQTWTVMAPMAVPRNYHSVAILMPDASVMVGGGGLCDGCSMNHYDGQLFNPPYLFTSSGAKATRPVIDSISADNVALGGSLTVTMNSAVTTFSIVRLGSATHTVNTDQRRIPLTPSSDGGNTYSITIPSDSGVALPGYWMLFAMDAAGVPSISKTIKIF